MSRVTHPASEAERQAALYDDGWLTPEEAGAVIGGMSAAHVLGWIASGALPALNVSRENAKRRTYRIARAWAESFRAERIAHPDRAAELERAHAA